MTNPHALAPAVRADIIVAAQSFVEDFWPRTETVTFHGSRYPEDWDEWDLSEVRCYQPDGRFFATEVEEVYGENGLDSGFVDDWERAHDVLASVHQAAWTFAEPEPWLAVVNMQTEPDLVWRVTTVTPLDYHCFEERPAD